MKTKAVRTITAFAVLFLASLTMVDISQARMGGGGHGSSSGSGMSRNSGSGNDGSDSDQNHMGTYRDRDENRSFDTVTSRNYRKISMGNMSNGGVLMELEPEGVFDGRFRVRFWATTQTGDLGNYNLSGLCTLEHGNKVLRPAMVDHMDGRHAEGNILFDLEEIPEHFIIVIQGVPGEDHMVYEW